MQMLNGKIPFMLLHILELANYKYEVTDNEALPSTARYKKPGSLMILNNQSDEDFVLKKHIRPGVYKLVGDEVVFFKDGLSLKDCKGEDTMLIFCRYNEGETIERGKRILKIMKLGRTMNDGDLNMKTQYLVRAVKKTFGIPG
jgi:hypothetical protein